MKVFKNEAREDVLSPWVTLVTRTVTADTFNTPQDFHSIRPLDYVCILAVTADGKIPIVRQYRPALDRFTLELPSGLLEKGENPQDCAVRELLEETGYKVGGRFHSLGCMAPDTGRLENRLWGFVALDVLPAPKGEWEPESFVETRTVTKAELKSLIVDGTFDHGIHLALFAVAQVHGYFSW
jgi:ADP-ribose pyrophosphatase